MKKIIAFSFFPAFVPVKNGGESRLFNFYRSLSSYYKVTLLTPTHINVAEEKIFHGLNFIERRIPKDNFFVDSYKTLAEISSGGDLSGPAIAHCGRMPTRLHQAYLEEYEDADLVFHDSPFTVEYDLFAGIDSKIRIYNSYNNESLLYSQLHPDEKSAAIRHIVNTAEKKLLGFADLVLYCSDQDLAAFREMVPNASFDALYAPNCLTPRYTEKIVTKSKTKGFRAVFMGSGHPPNIQAAEYIAHTLAAKLPEINFDIIGSCLPEGNYPANIHRHGVVNDAIKSNILRHSNIALNPMTSGSGSNVKVLDYFSFGLPVLSTSYGMRGINAQAGKEYIESSIDNFSLALRKVLRTPELLHEIGLLGRSLALNKYTWDAISQSVVMRIEEVIKLRQNRGRDHFVLALNDYDSFEGAGGGGTRTRGLYEAVQKWTNVVFICFSNKNYLRARLQDIGIAVINVPKTSEHLADLSRFNAQFHISADDIVASLHCLKNPWLEAVYQVLRKSARCIVVEHCYLARVPLQYGDRFVYSSHNNEAELKNRLLEWHPLKNELLPEVKSIERLAVECSAATIAVSKEDANDLVQGKRAAGPVIVVNNGASLPSMGEEVQYAKDHLQGQIGERAIVFLGSAHMPNVDAAQFIIQNLAPQCPDIPFHMLGSVCESITKCPPNVHLWGVVDEVTKSAVLQSCALAINPMDSGSGSNVKLADYLVNGLFVICTDFGQRGYPSSIQEHINVVPLKDFPKAIHETLAKPDLYEKTAKTSRAALFGKSLIMSSIAKRFVTTLKALESRKKRLLLVTYRYTTPLMGGAEVNIERFIRALGNSGEFDIDVIAPEVNNIHNHLRFGANYSFAENLGAPIDIQNVRFSRFPTDAINQAAIDNHLREAWSAQVFFEMALYRKLYENFVEDGLTWGWLDPESDGENSARWALTECGLHLHKTAQINLEGYSTSVAVCSAHSGNDLIGGPWILEGPFSFSFHANSGEIRLITSAEQSSIDPRPLGIRITRLSINSRQSDLAKPTLLQRYLAQIPSEQIIRLFDHAALSSRMDKKVSLTAIRGPYSNSMERYITDHVADYDLVVTHNVVFRPAVVAIDEAKKHGVPSILIPHAHLDDDFYHFPDLLETARNASLLLATPKLACEFFSDKGCHVSYLPAGCDSKESFTKQDKDSFKLIHPSERPFILVLGRKSGAKNYQLVIDAVEKLNQIKIDLQVVLIGPNDDGIEINSPNAVYLGQQPRNVVRGALLSSLALCNMSSSESFGIVLLEAWLAKKPVIANKSCAAFHDICDNNNSILTDDVNLIAAIKTLVNNPDLCVELGENGMKTAFKYEWSEINAEFVSHCINLSTKSGICS